MVGIILRNRLKFESMVKGYLNESFRSGHTRRGYLKNPKRPVIATLPCYQQLKNKDFSNEISVFNTLESKVFIGSKSNLKVVCWNCNMPEAYKGSTAFCNHCNSLQPLDKNIDLFEILGVTQSYKIHQSDLKKKYHDLQTLLHPDKFSTRPKREQEISEEYSSAVNKAYNSLLDPLERGLYLLSLHNISIEEGLTDIDKIFLMEIMERNENIESETDPVKLKEFYSSNREQLKDLISKVAEAFESSNLQLAKKLLTKMKYYNSIEVKIKDIKQKLNIPD